MKRAGKNLHIVETDTAVSSQEDISALPTVAAKAAITPKEKRDLFQVNRVSEATGQIARKSVSKEQLINLINYINFQDGTVRINFTHANYDNTMSIEATPQPCLDDVVECLWNKNRATRRITESFKFKNLHISNGKKLIEVEPDLIEVDEQGISLLLPDTSYEVNSRRYPRYACKGITAQLIQNSSVFTGTLVDFNGIAFRAKLNACPPQTFEWINPEDPVNAILSDGPDTLYCGECRIIRYTRGQHVQDFILEPFKQEIQRFKQKEHRSERFQLTPSPNLVFRHPFTKIPIDLKVMDLSGSGFSVEEDTHTTTLLPGMIIPKLELSFAGSYKLQCSAQVVFRKTIIESNSNKWIKCGLAMLDMDIKDHLKLIALLHQTKNRNSYICNHVELDALWDFFFETGFIYPGKYAALQKNKKQIKETYTKIYTQSPHIARHFIYQDKGSILGHMAMLRFYENAWMIHHHAARKSSQNKAGLIVLDNIGRMINDSHRLYSMHMDYIMCYFRPENKFPNRVFGGAARSINDPKGCSLDDFAYLHFTAGNRTASVLPEDWAISSAIEEDLQELGAFYEHTSGGLMLNALDLTPEKVDCNDLSREFGRLGLTRLRRIFTLKRSGHLKAVLVTNVSNVGLNLSDFTNCVKLFVLDPKEMSPDIVNATIACIADITTKDNFPLLMYPITVADELGIAYPKKYALWVCSLHVSDEYFKYLKRLLRFI